MYSAQAFKRALPVIAGMIAERANVPVIRGSHAMTDNQAIYLPELPELEVTMEDLIKAVAYLYHECGHLLHSDFSIKYDQPLVRAVCAVLEDVRIERLVTMTFPIAAWYLHELVKIYINKERGGFPQVTENDPEPAILQGYMLYKLRHDILRQTALAGRVAEVEAAAGAKLPAGMRTRLDALMYQVVECQNERDVLELGEAIAKMIAEEKQKEEEKQQQQNQGPSQSSSSGSDSENEPGSEQVAAGQAEGDGQANGQAGDSENGQKESTEQTEAANTGGGAGGACSQDLIDALSQLLTMGDEDVAKSLDEMLEDDLNQVARDNVGKGTSMPNTYPMSLAQSNVDMSAIKGSVNAVRTKTLAWMSTAAESDRTHTRMGAMIDPSRLALASLGGSIFYHDDEGIDRNAAISFMVDRSGSMSSEIYRAASAVAASILAFDVPGIKTQVSVFPVSKSGTEGVGVVKRWDESPKQMASRIPSLTVDGGTPMDQAIMWSAVNLALREETLRMVVVVTDGMPNDLQKTVRMIELSRQAGLAVVGLGIGCDVSQVFGEENSAMIHDINNLSGAIVKLIRAGMLYAKAEV